jgi:hypothetical protein
MTSQNDLIRILSIIPLARVNKGMSIANLVSISKGLAGSTKLITHVVPHGCPNQVRLSCLKVARIHRDQSPIRVNGLYKFVVNDLRIVGLPVLLLLCSGPGRRSLRQITKHGVHVIRPMKLRYTRRYLSKSLKAGRHLPILSLDSVGEVRL